MAFFGWIRRGLNGNGSVGARRSRQRRRQAQVRTRPAATLYRSLEAEALEDRTLLTVIALTPTKDNTLIENGSGSKSNGAGDVFVGLTDGDKIRRGLLAFDVAGNVPAGATINSVTLGMWLNRTKVGSSTIELHKTTSDWGEAGSSGDGGGGSSQSGDATWIHTFYSGQSWTSAGGDFSSTVSGSQSIGSDGASYTWASTAQMVADTQDWLDNAGNNFGWLLQGNEGSRSAKRFDSSESGTPSRRPTLTIDYTAAPVLPDISIDDVTLNEGNSGTTSFDFDITLSQSSTQTVTVDFTTANVEAVAGADYQTQAGTATFTAGQTSQPVSVLVVGETVVETSETFAINLSNPSNGTILDSQGIGTITNDDTAPVSTGDDIIGRQTASGDLWLAHSQGNGFTNTMGLDNWSTSADWRNMQRADVNGDGRDDLIGRNNNSGAWWVSSLDAVGTVTTTKWGKWSNGTNWNGVLVGDFNNDQRYDIVGRSANSGSLWVALSNGTKFHNQKWGAWSNNVAWTDVVVGDFDGNGYDDIAGRSSTGGSWWVASSNGTSFSNQRWGRWAPQKTWVDVQAGDFNNDGRTDIVGRDSASGRWWVANSSGSSFTNQKWGTWSTNVAWNSVFVGDLNGDNRSDIVGRAPNSGSWYVALSNGTTFATARWGSWSSGQVWEDVVLGDFNGDGNDEIAGRVQSNGDWWVALSTGSSLTNQKWGDWPTVLWDVVRAGEFQD